MKIKKLTNYKRSLIKKIKNCRLEANKRNDVCTESHPKISQNFNSFYTSIAQERSNKIASNANDDINHFKSLNRIENSIFLYPSSSDKVQNLIHNLNNKKSAGFDKISVRIFKSCKEIISPIISKLINLCFETGSYSDVLKIAKTVPIYKSGHPQLLGNYRPISLLSILNKIIEQVIHNLLAKFLNDNKFFYKFQYGFRHRSSTKTARVELFDKILNALDSGQIVMSVFLDLAKAFDTFDHAILIKKLDFVGIRGVALDLFKSYFNNRKQTVFVNHSFSDMKSITCGVPQVSVLGTLLFLIYISDIAALNLKSDPNIFADDTAMFYFDSNI